jgi:recombinational DNA repair protein RecR
VNCPIAPEITEVIIATDPNTEGEATASYLGRLLKDFPGLTVSGWPRASRWAVTSSSSTS